MKVETSVTSNLGVGAEDICKSTKNLQLRLRIVSVYFSYTKATKKTTKKAVMTFIS